MKIVFICGSLEPGIDGVGDYVRKLSLQLIQQGHQIKALALHDLYIQKEISEDIEFNDSVFSILRLPSTLSQNARTSLAITWINNFDPEWLSLQFVPFAFNKRGVPFGLGKWLSSLTCNAKWHIMFHETWLGEAKSDPYKEKILGWFQIYIIKDMIRKLAPKRISTSNTYYLNCLKRIGIDAIIVPIFSNISAGNKNNKFLINQLPAHVLTNRNDYIISSFFGAIHFNPYLKDAFTIIQKLAIKAKKKLIITHIGRADELDELWSNIQLTENDYVYSFGKQHEQDLADYFCQIDIGLSTNPKILFEKSGSIAAMLNNNLPVILLRKSFEYDGRDLSFIKEASEITDVIDFVKKAEIITHNYEVNYTAQKYIDLIN